MIKKRQENKISIHTCVICGKEFEAKQGDAKFCSKECRKQYYDKKYLEEKIQKLLSEGTENIDYVIDKWNGLPTVRIYGAWFKKMHPNRTLDEYKSEFPDALLTIPKDKENTSRNSGQFMKKEEYRLKYSKMFSGENNPNHRSKTSEQERKERSPFSKEFYIKRGLSESNRIEFNSNVAKNRSYNTRLDYYINKGYSEDEARILLYNRQKTFTLDKCIEKYGEIEGTIIYNERQKKWSDIMKTKYRNNEYSTFCKNLNSNAFSLFEINCINILLNDLQISKTDHYSILSNNGQFNLSSLNKIFYYDFTFNKKIIEFNGDYWHCNPNMYSAEYFNKSINMFAKDKWKLDEIKIQSAIDNGYDVLVIWESDYRKNPEYIIEKCKNFILS